MALGSGESAVLEIEVDVSGFERGMSTMESSAAKAQRQINADIERGVAAFDKQAKAAEVAAKKQQQANLKVAAGAVALIAAYKKWFDFLESGNGEAAKGFQKLSEEIDSLYATVAEGAAASGPMQVFHGVLSGLTQEGRQSEAAVRGLGAGIASIVAGPIVVATALLRDLAGAISEATGGHVDMPTHTPAPGESVASRAERARIAALGPNPEIYVMPELEITNDAPSGGGGGGDDFLEAHMREFNARVEAERDYLDDVLRLRKAAEATALERIKSAADAEREIRLSILRQTLDTEAEMRTSNEQRIVDEKRRTTDAAEARETKRSRAHAHAQYEIANDSKEWLNVEQTRAAALDATASAMGDIQVLMMQGGPAAQKMGKIMMAIQAAISAQKMIHEIGEAAAAAGRYDVWAAVQHGAAAVSFGIAAGMQLEGAIGGGGGGRSRGGGGGGGGGGGFASPRGGNNGGEAQRVEVTVNVSATDLGDRATMRRLGAAVSKATAAGFVQGRQAGGR